MTNRLLTLLLILLPLACHAKGQSPIEKDIEWANAFVDTNPDSALIAVRTIEDRYSKQLTKTNRIQLAIIRGNAWFSNGDVSKGVTNLKQAVNLSREAHDTTLLIQSLSDLGVMSRVAQHPDSALICYQEALQLMHVHGASADDEAHLLTSMAILYTNTNRVTDAVPFARKAVIKAEQSDNIETMMYAGSQSGMILFLAGHKEEGLAIERRIVSMAERKGAPRYVLKAYASIIDMHYKCGQTDSVMIYIQKGNQLTKRIPKGSVESLGFMEECYVVLAAMGRYRESLAIQQRILAMKDAGTYMSMDKLWLRIARNYDALGLHHKATKAYERSIAIGDSLRNTEIDNQLSEFQVKYDTMQKELDISRLEEDKARTTTWTIIVCAIFVLFIFALITYIIIRRRREAYTRISEHLKGVEEERGRLARDLHDGICNDLYGVSLLMASPLTDQKKVVETIRQISEDVRNISHELMPPRFKNQNLNDMLTAYAIQSKSFIDYQAINTEGKNLTDNVAYQVYRIIQELMQNIHKHTTATHVVIRANYQQGLRLTLSYPESYPNSYTDESQQSRHLGKGIGIENIQQRAELIGAHISNEHNEGITTITIEIA